MIGHYDIQRWLVRRGMLMVIKTPHGTHSRHMYPHRMDENACRMVSDLWDRVYHAESGGYLNGPQMSTGSYGTLEIRDMLVALLHDREDAPMVMRQALAASGENGWLDVAEWLMEWDKASIHAVMDRDRMAQ